MGICLNNIAAIYTERLQFDKACSYLQKAIDIQKLITDRTAESTNADFHDVCKEYAKRSNAKSELYILACRQYGQGLNMFLKVEQLQ